MAAGPIGPTWAAGSWADTAWQEDSWGESGSDSAATRRALNARRRRRCAVSIYRRFRGVK